MWPTYPITLLMAEKYDIIFVCPDGARTSWYLDSPVVSHSQYDTFISQELVPFIDAQYRTYVNPERRGIMGLSMGGHGAMTLAIRHPDVWRTAVSLSGLMDLREFSCCYQLTDVLGPVESNYQHWEVASTNKAADQLDGTTLLNLSIEIGVDDEFLETNRRFHAQLLEQGVPHRYSELPGGHTHDFWQRGLHNQMLFIDEHVNGNPIQVQSFD